MSERIHHFRNPGGAAAVALPFDLDAMLDDWSRLRRVMVATTPPDGFTRDEWAYLITFIDRHNLLRPFLGSFGEPCASTVPVDALIRPRRLVAVWLPNNVSLLGPLTLILLTLVGCEVRVKAGSRSENLTEAFRSFALAHLPEGALAATLRDRTSTVVFGRDDPRHAAWAGEADLRIVFGGDAAAAAIDRLPHPLDSQSFHFTDHCSEAWAEADALDDDALATLLRVFAIYGRAGCTSPRRLVLLDGTLDQARSVRDRLLALSARLFRAPPHMHIASECVMSAQVAMAQGWAAAMAPHRSAVFLSGQRPDLPIPPGLMTLPVVAAPVAEAVATLPDNIQTIGHCLTNAQDVRWLRLLATSHIRRFVPLVRMHHFGPVWDGCAFWRQCFEEVEIGA